MNELIDKELLKGVIDILILKLIKKNKEIYGYDMSKKIYNLSNNEYEIKEGTLYLALKRLETNQYLESFWETTESARRKKFYKITDKGNEYLLQKEKSLNYIHKLINKI